MTSHSIPCYLPSLIYFHHRTCHQLPHDASAYLSSVFSHHLEINFTGGGICVPRASYEASGKERIPFLSALPGQVIISPTWTVLNPSSPSNLQTSSCPQQEFSTLKLECNWFCYNRSWAPLLPNPTLPYCLQWTCTLSRRWLPLFPQSSSPAFIVCSFFSWWCELIPHCSFELICHCSFDLYFSNNEQYWASFHVFIGHLCVVGEMSA